MKKISFALLLLFAVAACTHPAIRDFNTWVDIEKPRAEKGEIKWSDFYKEGFAKIEKAPNVGNKAAAMERYNKMIQASQLYEQGSMTKADFEYIQRAEAAAAVAEQQAASAAAGAAMGQALKNYGNTVYGPAATKAQQMPITSVPVYQAPKQVRCVTNNNVTTCQEY